MEYFGSSIPSGDCLSYTTPKSLTQTSYAIPLPYILTLILHKISDIVSVFTSVSQSLRTGEPMHAVLPETLLDRLLLHHRIGEFATPDLDGHSEIGPHGLQSLDHMFYTSAVIAVYQLMLVRVSKVSTRTLVLIVRMCSAWTSFVILRVGFAGKYPFAVSRGGNSCTSQSGQLIRAAYHEWIRLLNNNHLLKTIRVIGKRFKGFMSSYNTTIYYTKSL